MGAISRLVNFFSHIDQFCETAEELDENSDGMIQRRVIYGFSGEECWGKQLDNLRRKIERLAELGNENLLANSEDSSSDLGNSTSDPLEQLRLLYPQYFTYDVRRFKNVCLSCYKINDLKNPIKLHREKLRKFKKKHQRSWFLNSNSENCTVTTFGPLLPGNWSWARHYPCS